MADYLVELTTDPEPRPTYEVTLGEYERLLSLGLVVNAPADPVDPDLFDQEIAQQVEDVNSQTRDVLDDRYVVGETGSSEVRRIRALTQGAYDALVTVDSATLYVIVPG